MKTLRLEKKDIKIVIELLNNDQVVCFPTDTVFGAAIRYDRIQAIKNLKEAKQRPETKPFPMMVSNKKQIDDVAVVSQKAEKLIQAFMPGAITLVFNKKENVSDEVTNGFKTIAIRMPDDEWIKELITKIDVPLLVPSANLSGEPACHTSDEVLKQLDNRVSAVVCGESGRSVASTIVDVTTNEYKILRQGPISEDEIKKVWDK